MSAKGFFTLFVSAILIVFVACSDDLKSKKKERPAVDSETPVVEKPEVAQKPPVPKTNVSQVAAPHLEKFKKLGLPTTFKECSSEALQKIKVTPKMREKLHSRRSENHKYLGDYVANAREDLAIAKIYEDEFDKHVEWLVTAAVNYQRGQQSEKANEVFLEAVRKRPQNIRVLFRYAIFLATTKEGIRNYSQALNYAEQAWNLAQTEKERNLAADAFAELANSQYGADSACSVLEEKASFSHAKERCSEIRNKYSRYTKVFSVRAVRSSLREAWRESGIPEGEPGCEESLYLLAQAAVQLTSDRQHQDAVNTSLDLLSYDMHVGYYSEYLTFFAQQLFNNGEKERAWSVFDLAAELAPSHCYPLVNKAAMLIREDPVANKAQVVELNEKAMKICNEAHQTCLHQAAINYKRVGEKQAALRLAKEGKTLFPTHMEFSLFIHYINKKDKF